MEMNPKTLSTNTITPIQPSTLSTTKDNRPVTNVKSQLTNGSVRESLDELGRLSNRVDQVVESEINR